MSRIVVTLASGGLDSAAAAVWAAKRWPDAAHLLLFYRYGQRSLVREEQAFDALEDIVTQFVSTGSVSTLRRVIPDMPRQTEHRNTLFVLRAVIEQPKASHIVLGTQNTLFSDDPPYADTTPEWLSRVEAVANIVVGKNDAYTLHAPFQFSSKADIAKYALDVCPDLISVTYSCAEGGTKEHRWGTGCGKCKPCVVRRQGVLEALRA